MSIKPITTSELGHSIKICTMDDVVVDGEMRLSREVKLSAWAKIQQKRGSNFNPLGVAVEQSRDTRTHLITIRYRDDVDISSAAWLFEERRVSFNRWFKVLGVDDVTDRSNNHWWIIRCRFVEKSASVEPAIEMPDANDPVPQFGTGVALPATVKL